MGALSIVADGAGVAFAAGNAAPKAFLKTFLTLEEEVKNIPKNIPDIPKNIPQPIGIFGGLLASCTFAPVSCAHFYTMFNFYKNN